MCILMINIKVFVHRQYNNKSNIIFTHDICGTMLYTNLMLIVRHLVWVQLNKALDTTRVSSTWPFCGCHIVIRSAILHICRRWNSHNHNNITHNVIEITSNHKSYDVPCLTSSSFENLECAFWYIWLSSANYRFI